MKKCIVIVGMPGSGKTHYGNALSKENGYPFLDDITPSNKFQTLLEISNMNQNVILSDVSLCIPEIRDQAANILHSLGYEIEWIFFEKNAEKCVRNVERRADNRFVLPSIHVLERLYEIPEGVNARLIWDGD